MREERAKSEIGYVLQGSIPKAHVNNSSRDGFCRNMTPPQNRAAVKGQQGGLGISCFSQRPKTSALIFYPRC